MTTRKRVLPEAAESWTDPLVDGFSKLEATYIAGNGEVVHGTIRYSRFFRRATHN